MKTHDRKLPHVWVLAIADKGIIAHASAHPSKSDLHKALVAHLGEYHLYRGGADRGAVWTWIEDRQETLSVEIVEQETILPPDVFGRHAGTHDHRHLATLLDTGGFVVLTRNDGDPSPGPGAGAPFEAWAYNGPLDFSKAEPVRFGVGADWREAIQALDFHLGRHPPISQPDWPRRTKPGRNGPLLCCPNCGNRDPSTIRYVEQIENWRQIQEVRNGVVIIDGLYHTGDGYDDGGNPRFECLADTPGKDGGECLHRWPVGRTPLEFV